MAKVTVKGYLNDPKPTTAKTGREGWMASFAESESIFGAELEAAKASGAKIKERNGKSYVNVFYNLRCYGDTPIPNGESWFGEVEGLLSVRLYTGKDGVQRISRDILVDRATPAGGSPESPAKRRATAPQRKAPDPVDDFEVPDDEIPF